MSTTPPPVNGSAGADSCEIILDGATIGRLVAGQLQAAAAVRTRKIAILGFGGTVKDCPWQDESWELWGMNGFWRAAEPDFGIKAPEERYTLWFDLHTLEYTRAYGKEAGFGDAQERWLEREHPFPIFMLDEYQQFPSVQRFPVEDVIATLGRDYFTSTVAYAITYALCLPDVAEIGLWGIDLVHDTEYGDQRPCAEYWIARGEAMGIRFTIHERSALMKQRYRYGYEPENELLVGLRNMLVSQAQQLDAALAKRKAEHEAMLGQMHTDDGALQAIRGVLQRLDIWTRGGQV